MYYTGIGSRETPTDVLEQMKMLGNALCKLGFILRSGGADGADTAFALGCDACDRTKKQIFLPWKGFNGFQYSILFPWFINAPTDQAIALGKQIHPAGPRLKRSQQLLIGRNMHQVLGEDLSTPSKFVVCWTPDGCEDRWHYTQATGGTGSAIACASTNDIPVFNLHDSDRLTHLLQYVKEILK